MCLLSVIKNEKGKNVKQSHYMSVRPYESWRSRLPEFLQNRHMKVARLSALGTGRRKL
jgi:hypothetical protein